jgi:hypothetical protein
MAFLLISYSRNGLPADQLFKKWTSGWSATEEMDSAPRLFIHCTTVSYWKPS